MNPITSTLVVYFLLVLHKSSKMSLLDLDGLIGTVVEVDREVKEVAFAEVGGRRMLKLRTSKMGTERIQI